jgi:23S rRNA pseudouridine955/2504/2580 synthase
MTSQHTISDDDDDIRLDRWFKRHYPGFPHAMLEKHLRKGQVRVDGRKAKTSDRVRAGQVITCPEMELKDKPKPKVRAEASEEQQAEIRKWVLHRDSNLIIINKPAGLAVQGGTKITKSVDSMLSGLKFDGTERPKLTHRIDRDTSGVLVLARNAKAAAQLAKGFYDKTIQKTYWALTVGAPLQLSGKIDLPLSKADLGEGFEHVGVDEEEGKRAVTEYRVIDTLARKFALIELKPITGRMHQLRVHMMAIGCPILGDHKYGGSMNDAKGLGVENILHLHARRIVIPAMAGQKSVDITAPLPPHMQRSFKALGLDLPKK